MKKIYLQPETVIVKVQTENLMGVVSNASGEATEVTGGGDYTGTPEDVLSRRGGLWDDDED